jgi:hypothetical protein
MFSKKNKLKKLLSGHDVHPRTGPTGWAVDVFSREPHLKQNNRFMAVLGWIAIIHRGLFFGWDGPFGSWPQ